MSSVGRVGWAWVRVGWVGVGEGWVGVGRAFRVWVGLGGRG